VFAPLKRALASETDAALRLDTGRISRVERVEMYIRARVKALTSNNIRSEWRGAGSAPLSPITVLDKLLQNRTSAASPPHTPPQQTDLDLSLLESSPPDGIELRQANMLLNTAIKACRDLPSPAKRFTERMTRAFEITNSENVTLRKQVEEQAELLNIRKTRTKGKRIALKGKFVFSTQEVLEIAKAAESETSKKRTTSQPRKRKIAETNGGEEGRELDVTYSDSDSDCIVVIVRR
jgi:hypothetical protein